MHILILVVILILILYGPHFWVSRTIKKYSIPRQDFPGSGGQFAEHLIKHCRLEKIAVKETDQGDHYDPTTMEVALSKDFYSGKSLSAIVIAAHEVGHALQHAQNYRPLILRSKLISIAHIAEKIGIALIFIGPIISLISHSTVLARITFIAILFSFLSSIIVHLVTLPVEFNASFSRALPILKAGDYLDKKDYAAAHKLLLAAALTYVSAALMTILDFARWWAILRR